MCGLVGAMGALGVTHERAFTDLLIVDAIRGPHSTGMASYSPATKDINIAKEVGAPQEVIRSSDYIKSMGKVNRLLLGHNRYATKGKINKENSHPFKHSHIVGAHNGTLSYLGQKKLEDTSHTFDTDSEAIFWSISTRGFEETWKYLANPTYEAINAFALTWFDTQTNKFHIVRNDKRPLFYSYSEKNDALFWASESGALHWIMARNGISSGKVYVVNADTLYTWDICHAANETVSNPHMTKLEIPEAIPTPTYNHNYSKWEQHPPFNFGHNNSNVTPLFPNDDDDKVAKFRPPYKNDRGMVLSKKLIGPIVDQGCFYCNEKNFKWGEFAYFPTFRSSNVTEFLCKSCYSDKEVKKLVMDCSNNGE